MNSRTNPILVDVHCGWGATYAAPFWNNVPQVRQVLAARHIQTAFIASDLARRHDLIEGNEQVADALQAAPDLLRGWLVLHPARLTDANAQMRRLLSNDLFVGCVLYTDPVTGAPVTLRESYEVITSFRRFSKPLMVEVQSADGMIEVTRIAQEFGSSKVIATGMGGIEWRQAIDIAAKFLNLYLDISGERSVEKIDYALKMLNGTRRLLFGSGAPHTDPAALIGLLEEIDISADERDRLFHVNAERLFGLTASAADDIGLAPLIPRS